MEATHKASATLPHTHKKHTSIHHSHHHSKVNTAHPTWAHSVLTASHRSLPSSQPSMLPSPARLPSLSTDPPHSSSSLAAVAAMAPSSSSSTVLALPSTQNTTSLAPVLLACLLGVLGIVAAVAMCTLVLICRRRRRRTQHINPPVYKNWRTLQGFSFTSTDTTSLPPPPYDDIRHQTSIGKSEPGVDGKQDIKQEVRQDIKEPPATFLARKQQYMPQLSHRFSMVVPETPLPTTTLSTGQGYPPTPAHPQTASPQPSRSLQWYQPQLSLEASDDNMATGYFSK